jgi:PAS domain S-box-containing protein
VLGKSRLTLLARDGSVNGRGGVKLTERQFEEAMEHSSIGTAFVRLDGGWMWSNKALRDLLGYSSSELKTKTFQELSHPEDLMADLGFVADMIAGRRSAYQMEKRYIRKDGTFVWAQLAVSLVRSDNGAPLFFISQLQDVTAQHAILADRSALAERLTLATRAGRIGVWEWDFSNDDLIWDERMFELYGLEPRADSKVTLFFDAIHPDDAERVRSDVEAAKRGERPYDIRFRIRRSDGETRQIQALATVVFDAAGTPMSMIGTNWDITEKQRLIENAEAASQAKSQFLAAMSHEIRTPLNGVMGMAQALSVELLSPSQRDRVQIIQQSGHALLQILNDILDLTKVEAGKLELENIPFVMTSLLEGVHATFAAIAGEKDLILNLEVGDAAGVYQGDPTRLRQVLANFISNALKFTAAGRVDLKTRRTQKGVEFTVSDTGIGIPPQFQERIFASFTQADASTTRIHGGTGLGLSICKHLAELMGGWIRLESEPGHGSSFTIALPLARLGDEVVAEAVSLASEGIDGQRLRVLVAEDNEVNRIVLAALLAQIGIEPTMVADGQAAVEAWERDSWDLLLMDIRMPRLDGVHATQAIRALETRLAKPRTPIIALTANAMPHHIAEYAAAGMDDFIAKPIDARALFGVVHRAAQALILSGEREHAA